MNPLLKIVLMCTLSIQGLADDPIVLKRFETLYRQKRMMKATFLETYSEDGHITRKEAGVAYFLQPGKMRWEYQVPEKNLFISDGKYVWFYVPADHTVTRMPARQSSDWRTPFALLAGEMKLSRLCAHWKVETQEHPTSPDGVVISCILHDAGKDKSDQGQHSLFLEIARGSGELARVTVRDPGGITIEFQFTNWRMDEPAAEALFRFSAPIGVTIVDGFNAPDHP